MTTAQIPAPPATVAQTTSSGVLLPSFGPPSPAAGVQSGSGGALVTGVLAGDDHCVWLIGRDGTRVSLVWPYGWRYDPATRVIHDANGRRWATLGEKVAGGGSALGDGDFPPGDTCVVAAQGVAFSPN